jgi:endonuclease/exonuclease/phosphatase family metal-dependent hydrolase
MRVANIIATLIVPALLVLGGCDDSDDNNGNASAPSAMPPVTLANLNVLHGFDCDSPEVNTQQCRVSERIALLGEHLVAAGCPDIVTLQEVINADFAPTAQHQPVESILELIESELPNLTAACGFTYQIVYEPLLTVVIAETDEELILSRYPVLQTGTRILYGPLYNEITGGLVFARHVLYARVDHPSGQVDVYTTHLASGSDLATSICGVPVSCPMECNRNDTSRACQAVQLALYVEQTRGENNLALITGDFNAVPDSTEYLTMTDRGWLDSHAAAGEPECDSASGIGCTSGRNSSAEDIENPALNVDRRIDYIFVALPPENNACIASEGVDMGTYQIADAGLFAGAPNPFSEACGSAPNALCWVSDHSGNQTRITCNP